MSMAERSMGLGLRALGRLAGSDVVDRLGVRKPAERILYRATRDGFKAVGAANRTFKSVNGGRRATRLPSTTSTGLFDLTPTEEQQMLQESFKAFGADQLRPHALRADSDARAPAGVASALALWGDGDQQATYLPAFVEEETAAPAAIAIQEPRALFDPFALQTTARRERDDFVLDGVKSLVPLAESAQLLIVAARLEGHGPVLFLVEPATRGVLVKASPAMGVRAAATGDVLLEGVRLPARTLLGDGDPAVYAAAVRRARVAWCALACGTGRAVLDYVIPHVNERVAFGEPISNRQSVAFTVSDIGIELEGMRLATLRAAARLDAGKDAAREVAIARALCSEKGAWIGSNGVQLLGGHGYVKEHPVERWYRDLRAVGVAEGALLV
jgi:alkylation response protein AidB-like acyl-CoA dehydrogenase